MKYRKKPIVIEAIQWNGNNESEICNFVGSQLNIFRPPSHMEWDIFIPNDAVVIVIPTLEGDMHAQRFDWIVKGVKGEFYPCKPDIFEQTYEPA
jgi:hypothetical protein